PQTRQADETQTPEQLLGTHVQRLEALTELDEREDVALDVEVPGDVCACETELVGGGYEATQRVRRADHEGRPGIVGARPASVVGAHREGRVGAHQRREELGDTHGCQRRVTPTPSP